MARCAVHLGRLKLFGGHRLQRGQQDQRGKGQPFPRHDEDDRGHRIVFQKQDRLDPHALRQRGEHAVLRMHEQVFPDRGGDGRHDEEGRDHQNAQRALTPDRLVDQQGDQDAEDDGDGQNAADQQKRVR